MSVCCLDPTTQHTLINTTAVSPSMPSTRQRDRQSVHSHQLVDSSADLTAAAARPSSGFVPASESAHQPQHCSQTPKPIIRPPHTAA
mmetsp:Transcript_45191/g.127596  ORF Transcript_45191/g.127596 Transcript_45191/m.127596 type:complete len:87 (+) Transcript_45191:167-427(+)